MNETLDPVKAGILLMETVSSVFADMAFVDVEPARPEVPYKEIVAPVRLAIDVLKPMSCRIELECTAAFKDRIEATVFMGDADGEKGKEDCLLEILNVIAGLFLTSCFGAGADVKLELPEYLFLSDGSEGEILASANGDAEGEALRAVLRSVRYRY